VRYSERAVGGAAAQFVQCIWSLGAEAHEASAAADPILPDGRVELLLNSGDPVLRHTVTGHERQSARQVAGQLTGSVCITPTGRLDIIGVRLHPWAGGAFLGMPMSELRDRMLPADGVWVADSILGDASNADDHDERLRLIVDALERRARGVAAPSPAAISLTGRLMRGPDTPPVRSLAAAIGLTTRRVEAIFAEQVGLTPKSLARIARLQRALAHARRRPSLTLSAVAHDSGYYDHAHFVRDCQDIAGEAPGAVLGRSDDVTTAFLDGTTR